MKTPFESIWCVECHNELGDGKHTFVREYEYGCPSCNKRFKMRMIMGTHLICDKCGEMRVSKGVFPSMTNTYSCDCGKVDVVWD